MAPLNDGAFSMVRKENAMKLNEWVYENEHDLTIDKLIDKINNDWYIFKEDNDGQIYIRKREFKDPLNSYPHLIQLITMITESRLNFKKRTFDDYITSKNNIKSKVADSDNNVKYTYTLSRTKNKDNIQDKNLPIIKTYQSYEDAYKGYTDHVKLCFMSQGCKQITIPKHSYPNNMEVKGVSYYKAKPEPYNMYYVIRKTKVAPQNIKIKKSKNLLS